MSRTLVVLAAAVAALALAVSAFGSSKAVALTGTVGPGYTITMNQKTVKAGKYTLTIKDLSAFHNFHLTGPGINKMTSVPATGTSHWAVTLKKGTYRYVCDPHASAMKGVLKVS